MSSDIVLGATGTGRAFLAMLGGATLSDTAEFPTEVGTVTEAERGRGDGSVCLELDLVEEDETDVIGHEGERDISGAACGRGKVDLFERVCLVVVGGGGLCRVDLAGALLGRSWEIGATPGGLKTLRESKELRSSAWIPAESEMVDPSLRRAVKTSKRREERTVRERGRHFMQYQCTPVSLDWILSAREPVRPTHFG